MIAVWARDGKDLTLESIWWEGCRAKYRGIKPYAAMLREQRESEAVGELGAGYYAVLELINQPVRHVCIVAVVRLVKNDDIVAASRTTYRVHASPHNLGRLIKALPPADPHLSTKRFIAMGNRSREVVRVEIFTIALMIVAQHDLMLSHKCFVTCRWLLIAIPAHSLNLNLSLEGC